MSSSDELARVVADAGNAMAQGIAARVGSQGELDKELALAVAFLASHAIKTSGRPVATANTIADAVEETMRELMLARAARGVQH